MTSSILNFFDTNTESCPHISLAVHSTRLFDRSRTLQNSEEKPKSSEESWEQVAVPPEEAKLAETPGGDSDIVSDNETNKTETMDAEMAYGVENLKAKIPRNSESKKDDDIEVFTAAEANDQNDMKKTTVNKKSSQILKLKRGITMDSGAGNNVMPRRMVRRQSDIRESEGSRNGVHYVAANNGRIPNEGEHDLKFTTVEGNEQCLTFQIAEVNKALCAVSYLVDKGYKVIFDKNMKTDQDTSYMVNKESGVITRYRRTRNVWVLDAFVDEKNGNNDQSFQRRG